MDKTNRIFTALAMLVSFVCATYLAFKIGMTPEKEGGIPFFLEVFLATGLFTIFFVIKWLRTAPDIPADDINFYACGFLVTALFASISILLASLPLLMTLVHCMMSSKTFDRGLEIYYNSPGHPRFRGHHHHYHHYHGPHWH